MTPLISHNPFCSSIIVCSLTSASPKQFPHYVHFTHGLQLGDYDSRLFAPPLSVDVEDR